MGDVLVNIDSRLSLVDVNTLRDARPRSAFPYIDAINLPSNVRDIIFEILPNTTKVSFINVPGGTPTLLDIAKSYIFLTDTYIRISDTVYDIRQGEVITVPSGLQVEVNSPQNTLVILLYSIPIERVPIDALSHLGNYLNNTDLTGLQLTTKRFNTMYTSKDTDILRRCGVFNKPADYWSTFVKRGSPYPRCYEYLLNKFKGESVRNDMVRSDKDQALLTAVKKGYTDSVQYLLDLPAYSDPEAFDMDIENDEYSDDMNIYMFMLSIAIQEGNPNTVELLWEYMDTGDEIELWDTHIYLAVKSGNLQVLKFVLDHINVSDEYTILDAAGNTDNLEMQDMILDVVLQESGLNKDQLLLQVARWSYEPRSLDVLLRRGADIHTQDDQALINAIENEVPEMVEYLLTTGANVFVNDGYPFRYAVNKYSTTYKGHLISTVNNSILVTIKKVIEPLAEIIMLLLKAVSSPEKLETLIKSSNNEAIYTLIRAGNIVMYSKIMSYLQSVYESKKLPAYIPRGIESDILRSNDGKSLQEAVTGYLESKDITRDEDSYLPRKVSYRVIRGNTKCHLQMIEYILKNIGVENLSDFLLKSLIDMLNNSEHDNSEHDNFEVVDMLSEY